MSWFNAIRSAKLNRLRIAFPGAKDAEVSRSWNAEVESVELCCSWPCCPHAANLVVIPVMMNCHSFKCTKETNQICQCTSD